MMRTRVTLCACLMMALGSSPLMSSHARADAPAVSESKADTGKTGKGEQNSSKDGNGRRRALPANYGSLGVSDEQRATLLTIQDDYEAKLDKLREEIKALQKERDDKMVRHLTEGQRTRLKELRAASKAKADAKAKESAAAK